MFANRYGYSDVTPYEVVRVISDKTIEIREMDSERDESVELKWAVGGFAGHCQRQHGQRDHVVRSGETLSSIDTIASVVPSAASTTPDTDATQ
jgi:hypothetical protein